MYIYTYIYTSAVQYQIIKWIQKSTGVTLLNTQRDEGGKCAFPDLFCYNNFSRPWFWKENW